MGVGFVVVVVVLIFSWSLVNTCRKVKKLQLKMTELTE